MGGLPPNPDEKIVDILSNIPDGDGWDGVFKNKVRDITRGDLMRLGGWMKKDGQGKAIEPLSQALQQLTISDLKVIAEALEKFNNMSYGTSVYFCCTCI